MTEKPNGRNTISSSNGQCSTSPPTQSQRQTIQDMAESTMNDLLEWYGYGKTGIRETSTLPAHYFVNQNFSKKSNPKILKENNLIQAKGRNISSTEYHHLNNIPASASGSPMRTQTNQDSPQSSNQSPVMESEQDLDSSDSETMKYSEFGDARKDSPNDGDPLSSSSRGSTPKSDFGNFWTSSSSKIPEPPEVILCFWCKRVCEGKGPKMKEKTLKGNFSLTNGDRHFCSEVCFNQSRRASFKKSKICDWCRHVRPTVTYVDFTDGDHQLQFCSDKCLNQYKMHIFCRETEAHLQLHPHLNDLKVNKEGTLITPDLWLRDCGGQSTKASKESFENDDETEQCDEADSAILECEMKMTRSDVGPNSQLSSSSSSPVSFDECQPVNLSKTPSCDFKQGIGTAKISPPPAIRIKAIRIPEGCRRSSSSRSMRPRNRDTNYNTNETCDKVDVSKTMRNSENGKNGSKPRGTIRVRQLEEQPIIKELEPTMSTSPSPSTVNPSSLHGFTGFGGLLMGARSPLIPGIPTLLPPPSELPRPQILPQLLLTHPDLLRLQGLRPPFILSQPSPIQQQPQPAQHNPMPSAQSFSLPSVNPNHWGFPPVTVLLPLPLPIPIPIPIPIPFPIPVKDFSQFQSYLSNEKEHETNIPLNADSKTDNLVKVNNQTSSVNNVGESTSKTDSSYILESSSSALANPTKTSVSKESTASGSDKSLSRDFETLPHKGFELAKADRKERRSILRYTSDVYEVNGVFVPRGGNWETTHPITSPTKEQKVIEHPHYPLNPSTSSTPQEHPPDFQPEERSRTFPGRKRRSESDRSQPFTKKKHLLT